MYPKIKFDKEYVDQIINATQIEEIDNILNKNERLTFNEFIALLSPVAQNRIEAMREKAAKLRRANFGRVVRFYAPIYLSNYCCNECIYCGFRASNQNEIRKRIDIEELKQEVEVLKKWGIDSIVLVCGEDKRAMTIDYFEEIMPMLRESFDYIAIEIQPLPEDEYRRMVKAGVHALTLYQETYDKERYQLLHKAGPKKYYDQRLEHLEYGGKAGFYQLGIGALLGLSPWRYEMVSLAAHGLWIMKHYWKSKVNFSFPRITPAGDFEVPYPVSEVELEQIMLAFRIFFPENDIYLSTRESASFRDRLALTAATVISSGSKVSPGAYAESENHELPQFTMNDNRSVAQMIQDFKALGLEVVFKDWDPTLSTAI